MDRKILNFFKFFCLFLMFAVVSISTIEISNKTIKETKKSLSSFELQVKDKQKDSVILSWDEFVPETEDIYTYKIYMNEEYIGTTNDKFYVINSLDSTKSYNFRVEFINSTNEVILEKEISNINTAKVIEAFVGEKVYSKDVYYVQTNKIDSNCSAIFEAGSILKFETTSFEVLGNLELNGNKNDKVVIASSNYNGSYNTEDTTIFLDSLSIKNNSNISLNYVDVLCNDISIDSQTMVYMDNIFLSGVIEAINSNESLVIKNSSLNSSLNITSGNSHIENNSFSDGFKITYTATNNSIFKLINNTFDVSDEEYLNLQLGNCTEKINENILNNITGNINNGNYKYNILLGGVAQNSNIFLKKDNYYFNFSTINFNLEIEKGSNIFIEKSKNLVIEKSLKLSGTEEEKISIDSKDSTWSGLKVSESGTLEANSIILKNIGNSVWLENKNNTKIDNVTFVTSEDRKNLLLGKNSITEINNSVLTDGINISPTTSLEYKKLKLENCTIPSINIQFTTSYKEVNETILLNNNVERQIVYKPNILSTAIIKNNNILQESVSPLKLDLVNADNDILDNISDNISPNIGNYGSIELISLPSVFTLKKDSYYVRNNSVFGGIKNIEAGCCIKLGVWLDLIIGGQINFNGTEQERIIVTSIKDDGFNLVEKNDGWKYLYVNYNASYEAKYVDFKNGGINVYITGNVYWDNVRFDESSNTSLIVYSSHDVEQVTTSITNSRINRLNLYADKKRITNLVNNDVYYGITYNYYVSQKAPVIKGNISKNIYYPVTFNLQTSSKKISGNYFNNVSENHNFENTSYDYITLKNTTYLNGTLPKNKYNITKLIVDTEETCVVEKGAQLQAYGIYVYGNLICNGTSQEAALITDVTGEFRVESNGTLISNHTNYYNSSTINVYGKIYMINSDFSKDNNNGKINLDNSKGYLLKYNYLGDVYYYKVPIYDLTYNYWGEGVVPNNSSTFVTHPYNTTFIKTDLELEGLIKEEKIKERNFYGVDGVNSYTGNYSISYDDFNFKVDNIDLNLSYTYNSLNEDVGILGKGWNFGVSSYILDSTNYDDKKYVYLPNGSVSIFVKDDDSNTYNCMNSRNELIEIEDGFELITLTMTRYVYNSNGYLYKIVDKYGNEINLDVDENGKISKVITFGNKEYLISYENDKISKITDPIGRQAQYIYNLNEMLSQVIGVDGKSTYFEYDEDGYLISIKEENDNNEQVIINEITYYKDGKDENKIYTLKDVSGKIDTYVYDASTTITDQNSRKKTEYYNLKGYITKLLEPNNTASTISYNSVTGKSLYYQISSKTDITGKTTYYAYDSKGNILTETIANKINKYTYNDKNSVTSKIDANSNEVKYEYAEDGVTLLKEIYLNKGKITYEYDSEASIKGLPIKKIDQNGNITTYEYDSNGKLISETDSLGNVTRYTYNDIGWMLTKIYPNGNITMYEYNNNGDVTKVIENGIATISEYNYKSNKIKEIDRNLNVEIFEYDNAQNLIKEIDKEGKVTVYEYDIYNNKIKETTPNNTVYTYEYDTINRHVKTNVLIGDTSKLLEEKSYSYSIGNQSITTKKYQDDTTYSTYIDKYNANGDITSKELGSKKEKSTYSNTYKITQNINEIGKKTYYAYDKLDRIIKKYEEVETNLYKITKYEYDLAGNVIKEYTSKDKVDYYREATNYNIYTHEYDSANNLIKTTSTSGEEIKYTYDGNKNKIKEEIKITDNKYKIIEYTYNYANKVTSQTEYIEKSSIYGLEDTQDLEKLVTTYEYDNENNLIKETSPNGKVKLYKYDKNGRQIETEIVQQDISLKEEIVYDNVGNVISKKDANSNTTLYVYNELNQMVQEIKPNDVITYYEYDLVGNLINERAPNGSSNIEYTYNLYNQMIKKTVNLGEAEDLISIVTDYEYDYCDNLTKETIDSKSTVYEYNKAGEIVTKIDANNNSITYTYDAMLNVISCTDAKGNVTNYSYDERNNLIKTTISDVVQYEATYDLLNNKISTKDELGNEIVNTYDTNGNLVKSKESDTGYEIIYKYDKDKNLLLEQDNCNLKVIYEYDIKGNVVKEASSKVDDTNMITLYYEYDKVGNKIKEIDGNGNVTIYSYDANNNLTKQVDANLNETTFTYDKNGNMLSETNNLGNTRIYYYDGIDRLIEKKDAYNNVIEKLEYDSLGRQIKSIDANGNSITYEYDNTENVIKQIDQEGNTEIYEYDKNYNKVKYYDKNNNVTTYEYDYKNNLIKVVNALNETTTYTYDNMEI